MGEKVSWFPLTKIVQITKAPEVVGGEDQVNFDVKTDLYSDGKEDWIASGELNKFVYPVRGVGGQDLPGEKVLGSTFFLDYGWRIRPYEDSHVFNVNGNLYTDTGDSPFTQTVGAYNVMTIHQVSSLVDSTVTQLSEIEYMAFGNYVNIDVSNGEAGTVYPSGTEEYPVNNWDDAAIISENVGINRFRVSGSLNISGDLSDKAFMGLSPINSFLHILPGSISGGVVFERLGLSGEFSGIGDIARECFVSEISNFEGLMDYSYLMGPIGLKNGGTINLLNCFDGVVGTDLPVVDINGDNAYLSIHSYHGSIKLINKTGPSPVEVRMDAGIVVLDSTISSGEISLDGMGRYINNSTGNVNLNTDGLISKQAITEVTLDKIYVNTETGTPGTDYPQGTSTSPISVLADAKIVADSYGIEEFHCHGEFTLDDDYSGYIFESHNPNDCVVHLGGQAVVGTFFERVTLSGEGVGKFYASDINLHSCINLDAEMDNSYLLEDCSIKAGKSLTLRGCKSTGLVFVNFDLNGTGSFMSLDGAMQINIENMTDPNCLTVLVGIHNVVLKSSITAGIFFIGGSGKITNNSTSLTQLINELDSYMVWEELSTEHRTAETIGASMAQLLGLSQENYYLDQAVYTTYNSIKLLTSGRIRTYTNPASVGTNNDVLATYTITAVWNNDELQTYGVVKT